MDPPKFDIFVKCLWSSKSFVEDWTYLASIHMGYYELLVKVNPCKSITCNFIILILGQQNYGTLFDSTAQSQNDGDHWIVSSLSPVSCRPSILLIVCWPRNQTNQNVISVMRLFPWRDMVEYRSLPPCFLYDIFLIRTDVNFGIHTRYRLYQHRLNTCKQQIN